MDRTRSVDAGPVDSSETEWRLLQLPADLIERVIGHCPTNDVPCCLRLVNRAAAAHFRAPHHLQVHLSLSVPHHAFCHHWGQPDALRALTLVQRRQLLCLTARSGSTDNLGFIVPRIGCPLADDVFIAAASSGQLASCRWLRSHACPCSDKVLEAAAAAGHIHIVQWLWGPHTPLTKGALRAAARGGHEAVCGWLLSCGCPWSEEAPASAAYGGHVALMYELLDEQPTDVDFNGLLVAAADGCDLATLQGLLDTVSERRPNWQGGVPAHTQGRMLSAAASSATPDWRAKVEWMQSQGYQAPPEGGLWSAVDWARIAAGPEPAARLAWLLSLQTRGTDLWGAERPAITAAAAEAPLAAFAAAGNTGALQLLLDSAPADSPLTLLRPASAAASAGHLPALELLHARCTDGFLAAGRGGGSRFYLNVPAQELARRALLQAVGAAHLHVVEWAVHQCGGQERSTDVFVAAGESGSLELLQWLRERGFPWLPSAFKAVAGAGNVAALEWLAEQGCPMPDSGGPYTAAAAHGDMATLRCLRRLGCPWGPVDRRGVLTSVARRAGHRSFAMPVLRWLVAEGCPVDWQAALRELPEAALPGVRVWMVHEAKQHRLRVLAERWKGKGRAEGEGR